MLELATMDFMSDQDVQKVRYDNAAAGLLCAWAFLLSIHYCSFVGTCLCTLRNDYVTRSHKWFCKRVSFTSSDAVKTAKLYLEASFIGDLKLLIILFLD